MQLIGFLKFYFGFFVLNLEVAEFGEILQKNG